MKIVYGEYGTFVSNMQMCCNNFTNMCISVKENLHICRKVFKK